MINRLKILIAKPGLDGHDLGAKLVAAALRDAGFDVVYLGLQQTPEQIATAASQEDADVIGCSFLSGAHLSWTKKIMAELKKAGVGDTIVLAGGAIPKADIPQLKQLGVFEVFPTGTTVEDVIRFFRKDLPGRWAIGNRS